MTNASCSPEMWCSSAGVIINVLLAWQASRRANAIMQPRSSPGYLDWAVTKWELFGHGWSAGFVCSLSVLGGVGGVGVAGCTLLPVKIGIWKVLFHPFHPATCHRLIHKVPRRPFSSPSRSRALKHGQNRQTQACISRAAWKFTWRDLRCCLLTHN